MRLLSRLIRPTREELIASPLFDPDFLAKLYHLVDGEPVPESTKHGDAIFYLYEVLSYRFAERSDVFVAQNLLWYFEDELPRSELAPDVFVAFGAEKAERSSFAEWQEKGIRPQYVFEVVSPNDTSTDIRTKQLLYKSLGVKLAVVVDGYALKITGDAIVDDGNPDLLVAEGTDYSGRLIPELDVALSYDAEGNLHITDPNGRRYPTPVEALALAEQAESARSEAESARSEAESARSEADRLRQRLRDAGIEPDDA